jgi:L-alanine-DL-glutamate epimerase-like enolase superfamily enzyme
VESRRNAAPAGRGSRSHGFGVIRSLLRRIVGAFRTSHIDEAIAALSITLWDYECDSTGSVLYPLVAIPRDNLIPKCWPVWRQQLGSKSPPPDLIQQSRATLCPDAAPQSGRSASDWYPEVG